MKVESEEKQFDVLGHKIRFSPDNKNGEGPSAEEVVDYVRQEAYRIKENSPNLETAQISLLLALKFANENLQTKKKYQEGVSRLQEQAKEALSILENAPH